MAATHEETELTYLIAPEQATPDLSLLPKVRRVGSANEIHLEATYFDTPDASLARHRITLRRRTGGTDDGWHLKTPGAGPETRLELQVELGDDAQHVPPEIEQGVRAYVRSNELAPIATLETRRVERALVDADDHELALVADDLVHARRSTDGGVDLTTWREIEVELVDGSPKFFRRAEEALRRAGLEASPYPSKLHHALDQRHVRDLPALDGTAGSVAHRHIAEQVRELLSRDHEARTDQPDGVHKMRVAARRLRSALATYRALFDRARTDPVRDELQWLGTVLGAPRDLEVLRERLTTRAHELPVELLLGPVVTRIDTELALRHQEAHAALVGALETPRYFSLLDALDRFVDEPPFGSRASRPADQEVERLVHRASRRVRRAAAAVDGAPTEDDRLSALHEVRKAAKRARYAAESAEPILGSAGRRLARRMEDLQELLGEVQDSVVSRRALRELGVAAHLASENGFSFGLLSGREERAAEIELESYEKTLRRALDADRKL